MAERDPDTIKQDIDKARDQLASTVDSLAVRANPRRLADDAKARAIGFVKKPAVVDLAGRDCSTRRRPGGAPNPQQVTAREGPLPANVLFALVLTQSIRVLCSVGRQYFA